MKKFIAVSILFTSIAAQASVKIPYFQALKEADVCGAVPSKCQPTSSLRWSRVSGLDYRGISMLGRKYSNSIFETSPCTAEPPTEGDVIRFGRASVTGALTKSGKVGFGGKANAALDNSVNGLVSELPDNLRAKAKVELSRTIENALNSNIDLSYERIDLSQTFIDSMGSCLSNLNDGDRVITGLSVISTSGSWTRSRIATFVAAVEALAEFQSLDVSAQAGWRTKKNVALSGKFEPVTFVFAVAFRKK